MAKRVRLSRKKGYRKPSNTVNVARPTRWGNPFNWQKIVVRSDGESQKRVACRKYEKWLKGESPYEDYEQDKRKWILDHIHELAGKDLACWCKEGDACHADVLIRLANKS